MVSRLWSAIQRANERISNAANLTGIIVAFLLAFLITGDIIGRYFLNKPITGVYEIAEGVLVFIAFFGFSYTQRHRRHINVELLIMRFPGRVGESLGLLSYLLGLFLFGTIVWMGWDVAWHSWLDKEWYEGILRLPVYPTKFGVVAGTGLLCFQYIIDTVNSIIKLFKGGAQI